MTTPSAAQLENRRAWVAALRSGNYRQQRRALRRHDSFCCLGVAEDVTDCEWREVTIRGDVATHMAVRPEPPNQFVGVDGALTSLTYGALDALGLVERVPRVTVWQDVSATWGVTTLVRLNDEWRYNFARIADVIEDQPESWNGDHNRCVDESRRRTLARERPRDR